MCHLFIIWTPDWSTAGSDQGFQRLYWPLTFGSDPFLTLSTKALNRYLKIKNQFDSVTTIIDHHQIEFLLIANIRYIELSNGSYCTMQIDSCFHSYASVHSSRF